MPDVGNSLKHLCKNAYAFALASLILLLFVGWGATGHRIINRNAPVGLPVEMTGFLQRASMLADSASNADNRKSRDPSEGPKHFIDIDHYPEFATRSVPHSLDSLIQKYGSSRVTTDGLNPWATVTTMDSLTAQMERGDWNRVWSTAADLGHYVGDAHQPLHCTENYDGKQTGNSGIHSRYESGMVDRFQQSISVQPSQATYVESPIDFVFNYTYQSNSYCDSIFAADNYAKQASGWSGSGQAPDSYYSALWSRAGNFTVLQFQRAVDDFSSLVYTSWVNAGRPAVPTVVSAHSLTDVPAEFKLENAYPNPFNPATTIRYQLPQTSDVSLQIFNTLGQRVATLVDGRQEAGPHQVQWNTLLPSGAYYFRLEARQMHGARIFVATKRMVVVK
jgi:hypothetical protein